MPCVTRTRFATSRWGLLVGLVHSGCCALAACPPASQYPTARAAIDNVRERHACSRGLRGEAKLDYFDASGRVRVDAYYLSAHPQSLRFDLVSPFGTPLSTLTVDRDQFALLDREARVFYVGQANACNVGRFLRVPVPPEVLVQLLAGEAPILVHNPEQSRIAWEGGRYVVEIESLHGASQRLEFEPFESDFDKPYGEQRLRLIEVAVTQQGVLLYSAQLRDHFPVSTAAPRVDPDGLEADIPPSGPSCRAEIPRRIRFEIPVADRDVVFEQTSAEHNPPLLPNSFTQEQPPGVRRETSSCR